MSSKDLKDLLEEAADLQLTRRARLLKHLQSNPDISMPLLKELRQAEVKRKDRKPSKSSEPTWIDMLREDNPGLTEEQLRQIAKET